jgi:hypothetical protein
MAVGLRQLHDEVVRPIAVAATRGTWYRQWRVVSVDGSTMDEEANFKAFGRPGSSRGSSAYPQFRFVCLVESGTHVLFGTRMSPYATGEKPFMSACSRKYCRSASTIDAVVKTHVA